MIDRNLWPEGGPERVLVGLAEAERGTRTALEARAASIAERLAGLPPGEVAVQPRTRVDFVEALLGVWYAGRVAVLPHGRSTADSLSVPRVVSTHVDAAGPHDLALDSIPVAARADARRDAFRWSDDAILVRLVTSGTTGTPLEESKTAAQLFGEVRALDEVLPLAPGARVASTVPFHHLYGLLFAFLQPLSAGAAIVLTDDTEPSVYHPLRLAETLRAFDVERWITVPAHLGLLLDAQPDLGPLRDVVSSAAPLSIERATHVEARFFVRVWDVLGSTETGGLAFRRPAVEPRYRALPSVLLETNAERRLFVTSPFASTKGKQATGDRGLVDEEGFFCHEGRDDGVVKVGGKRVTLGEIESQVRSVVGDREVAALAVPVSGLRGEELWVALEGLDVDVRDLRARLLEKLDPVFVPRRFRLVERLPRNERGKVERAALRALFDDAAPAPSLSIETPSALSIPRDSPRFDGHFPGNPVYPAVALLHDFVLPEWERRIGPFELRALERLRFTRKIGPGAELVLRFVASSETRASFEVREGDELAASGRIEWRRAGA